jgi:hypothetical protein
MELSRRRLIWTAVGASILPEAFAVRQQVRDHDEVFDQILKEKGIVIDEIRKNNNRLTTDTAKRLASLSRTLVVYGRSIRLDEAIHQRLTQAVTIKGRDSIIDARIDPDHMAHELAQYGLNVDVGDLLRQLPVVGRQQKEQTLDGMLMGQITLLGIEAILAEGFERMAAMGRLAAIPQPARPQQVVQRKQPQCNPMNCGYWVGLAGTLSGIAGMICPVAGPEACAGAWAAVTAAWLGYWGCLAYNATCGGGNK